MQSVKKERKKERQLSSIEAATLCWWWLPSLEDVLLTGLGDTGDICRVQEETLGSHSLFAAVFGAQLQSGSSLVSGLACPVSDFSASSYLGSCARREGGNSWTRHLACVDYRPFSLVL